LNSPNFLLRAAARCRLVRFLVFPTLLLKREVKDLLEPDLLGPGEVRHSHQKLPVLAPPILVLLPRQVLGVADLPATRFPHFFRRPRSADVHLDLVNRAQVRLSPEHFGVVAPDVIDGAVHVVEGELGDSADCVGRESGILLVADVVEAIVAALAGVVGVAVQDGAVARRQLAGLRLAFDPTRKNLETDEGIFVVGKLEKESLV